MSDAERGFEPRTAPASTTRRLRRRRRSGVPTSKLTDGRADSPIDESASQPVPLLGSNPQDMRAAEAAERFHVTRRALEAASPRDFHPSDAGPFHCATRLRRIVPDLSTRLDHSALHFGGLYDGFRVSSPRVSSLSQRSCRAPQVQRAYTAQPHQRLRRCRSKGCRSGSSSCFEDRSDPANTTG